MGRRRGSFGWLWAREREASMAARRESSSMRLVVARAVRPSATVRTETVRLAARVTSLEYDHAFAAKLGAHLNGSNAAVIQGDAATLPFADGTFSSAIAILMLHHLRSNALQHRAFAETWRVLRPGGVFLAFEIQDGWLHRVGHIKSTFVPLAPASASARLTAAGFSKVTVDIHRGGYRILALRSLQS